ncbi:uncharacterized protein LOC117572739 [Drosophila albomicans]|uniref:Uncharacterized protein LOC117572739 n=1 Tax=Drosophila albomicans TaxID=7291 RepID=A0A6P8X655_DROAB|nr:uncharacterized protein LOC117572739 [Drosophila albomicans]
MATTFAGSKYPKLVDFDEYEEQKKVEEDDGDDDEEEEEEEDEDSGSTSSFSLQDCLNEFRTRRIRRVSTHSRDAAGGGEERQTAASVVAADAHLINQNLCNKAQERRGKPCKNGFCYCFTSDSGDCGSTVAPREWHVRQHKRSRRADANKLSTAQQSNQNNFNPQPSQRNPQTQLRRQSENRKQNAAGVAVASHKSVDSRPLTAVSSLHAVGDDAPLIHIIQELRDNCVISEVRVNKQKLPNSTQISPASTTTTSSSVATSKLKKMPKPERIEYKATAPPLSNISEQETPLDEDKECDDFLTEATSLAGESFHSSRRKCRRSSSGGGRLLQKRLSNGGQVNFKPRDVEQPPPKPPRRSNQSLDGKMSLSSLTSTTPSVRDAERVLDEFLRKHGVQVPSSKVDKAAKTKSNRKSYPLAAMEKPVHQAKLATCPSLSDIERVVESKRGAHYAKNIHMASNNSSSNRNKSTVSDKPMKEIMLGWTEPKINDMLNYDAAKQTQFKTHAPEPAPQVAHNIGWQVPQSVPVVPKISLDTVDGVSDNLESNMQHKHTPIKYAKQSSQKFIWGEQWRNLSPWNGNKQRPSGLRNKSKKFLNNSKNKILRFVSPKKSNQPPRLCTVGVQTSTSQLQLDLQSQSPPGSYHSPVQSTPSATITTPSMEQQQPQYKDSSEQAYFDFQRKVKPPTPPKKVPRGQRRKLNFQGESNAAPATYYRSYQKDIDQDVTITKMGYLLSSIRAKLEASDENATRTFQESSRFAPLEQRQRTQGGFDCVDGPITRTKRSVVSRHQPQVHEREPIYSEIEEDCMHISGSPQFDVRNAALLKQTELPTSSSSAAADTSAATPLSTPGPTPTKSSLASATGTVSDITPRPKPFPESPVQDFSALYATVQKSNKSSPRSVDVKVAVQPRPLGQFLQESLMNGSFFQFMPLPDEPASDTSYTVSTLRSRNLVSEQPTLPMHHSLNNINEQHSPPKKNRNLSKSELSLQRSEIFLENLCRSEIVLDHDDNMRLEKVPNTSLKAQSAPVVDDDTVSYDMPNEVYDHYVIEDANSSGQSQYGSVQLEPPPPSSDNQSTPKKQSQHFTTKPTRILNIDINDGPTATVHKQNVASVSCPTTPQQPDNRKSQNVMHGHSLVELTQTLPSESNLLSMSTLTRYRLLKDAVRRSYRKGKDFLLAEKQRLTHSLNMSRDQTNQTEGDIDSSNYYSAINLDSLLNESLSTNEQLAQAVSICRQLPELEISSEMVEAERLLLFTTLRKQTAQPIVGNEATSTARRESQCFLIDALHLPIKADVNQDVFFNYYYICTVESEGRIRSTQSIECHNGAAIFRDCGLEFYSDGAAEELELRCQIFMLRLRKVSTLSLEPPKALLKRGSGSLGSASSSSSSQSEQIVSRFRLHASFTLKASDLVPYELVMAGETQASDRIWLRTSRTWQLPLTSHTKSSNLMPQIALSGRVELRLPKSQHSGYLNVQDTKHNWNRRWCTLNGLRLSVWQHEQNLCDEPPLLQLQLEVSLQSELDVAPRELCARARSFQLLCSNTEAFFAADTQPELVEWLQQLNEALTFARRWLKQG